jgi:hypothetical protein
MRIHMSATAVADGDEDVRQMCATVAQAGAGTGGNALHSRCQLLLRMRWLLPNGAVRAVLCKDAHQMHAAVGSGGDENLKLM